MSAAETLRSTVADDVEALVALGASTGLFSPTEAKALLGDVLEAFHNGQLGEGHECVVLTSSTNEHLGWAYFAPTAQADGVYDLWWIGVEPESQGCGHGATILHHVETRVQEKHGRLLVIETSSLPLMEGAWAFYKKHGYEQCGRIPDFYARGDDKIIFVKSLL